MADNDLIERLRMEAQIHAQEARTAKATIAEIYQLCSGGNGEPGNWHGAAPVRELVRELQGLRAARMAYASEFPANEDGEPDVGSIHQNIRKLKAEAATLRQQAGRVDEGMVERALEAFCTYRCNTDDAEGMMRAALTAALAQNTQWDGEPVAEVYEYPRDHHEPVPAMLKGIRFTGMPLPVGTKLYLHAERARVPEMIVDLAECRKAGWNDGARAYRAGWNDCRAAMLAAAPSQRAEVE